MQLFGIHIIIANAVHRIEMLHTRAARFVLNRPALEEALSWQCLFHDIRFELATTSSEEAKFSIDFAF